VGRDSRWASALAALHSESIPSQSWAVRFVASQRNSLQSCATRCDSACRGAALAGSGRAYGPGERQSAAAAYGWSRSGGGTGRCAHRCSLRVEVTQRRRFVAPCGLMFVTADQRGGAMRWRVGGGHSAAAVLNPGRASRRGALRCSMRLDATQRPHFGGVGVVVWGGAVGTMQSRCVGAYLSPLAWQRA
jgi:hypothetical protein